MRIAICDNDVSFLTQAYKDAIRLPCVSDVEVFSDYMKLYDDIIKVSYDAILMNLEWNGNRNGILIAEHLNDMAFNTPIIFVTNHIDRFVQEIFFSKCNLQGVLMKPIDFGVLQRYLEKIQKQRKKYELSTLIVKENGRQILIPHSEILYIESEKHRMNIFSEVGEYQAYKKMNELVEELPKSFVRCHRSYIINIDKIRLFGRTGVSIVNGKEIPVGRKYMADTQKRYVERVINGCN